MNRSMLRISRPHKEEILNSSGLVSLLCGDAQTATTGRRKMLSNHRKHLLPELNYLFICLFLTPEQNKFSEKAPTIIP